MKATTSKEALANTLSNLIASRSEILSEMTQPRRGVASILAWDDDLIASLDKVILAVKDACQ